MTSKIVTQLLELISEVDKLGQAAEKTNLVLEQSIEQGKIWIDQIHTLEEKLEKIEKLYKKYGISKLFTDGLEEILKGFAK